MCAERVYYFLIKDCEPSVYGGGYARYVKKDLALEDLCRSFYGATEIKAVVGVA